MLSILHPETTPHLEALPIGLLPFRDTRTGKLLIALKATKEMILAARMNRGFKIYVAPLTATIGTIPALVTAFFDDVDEPLIIVTPLFSDGMLHDIKELLAYEDLDIYFVDEHNREWMSYHARLKDGGSCFINGTELTVIDFSHGAADLIYEGVKLWFGYRTHEDDARAITIFLTGRIGPDDLFIMDCTDLGNDYLGGSGYSHSALTRGNPGAFQERDLAASLRRVFPGSRIAINPLRKDNGKELVDILVLTPSHVLLIQAKDSPNTEESLRRSLGRKRLASRQQAEKGVRQAKGAVAHIRTHDPLNLIVGGRDLQVIVGTRALFAIVVIKEIFGDEGEFYAESCREMALSGVQGIILDYPNMDLFTHKLRGGDDLISGLEELHASIVANGSYINPQSFLSKRLSRF